MAIDNLWMMSWCAAAILTVFPGGSQGVRPVTVMTLTSMNAADGVFDKESQQVIRDTAAWADLWSRMTANVSPAPQRPAVDFTKDMVIVAAMGSRGRGGFKISFGGGTEKDGVVTVNLTESSPGPNCMTAMVMTSPVVIGLLPRSAAEVKFNIIKKTADCDPR